MSASRSTALAALALLLLPLAACSSPSAEPVAQPPGRSPSSSPSSSESPASEAAPVEWQPVDGPTDLTVTTNPDGWTLSYDEERARATLTGPQGVITDPARGRVSDALLSAAYAVVVHQARDEGDPATAVVTDLATGATTTLDAGTPGAPTTSGGTWALDGARAAYASVDADGDYCLAEADLAGGTAREVWCADDRQGFNAAHLSETGDALLTFDDAQPACRTLVTVDQQGTTPFDGVTPCLGFEGLVSDVGQVWSEVSDAQRVEAGTFFARVDGATTELGPGTSGTLVACGSSTWFVRDAQGDDDAEADTASLMRWDGTELTAAWSSRPGRAFLSAPRCAGGQLTVSSFSEGGDEQVTALVG